MTAPTTTAATPEELARTARLRITKELCGFLGFEAEEIIATAIRQHSEAQRAEIERLTKELSATGYALERACKRITDLDGKGDMHWNVRRLMLRCAIRYRARATTAETALAAVTAERDRMREALSKPGMLVYLDSRTEDAAHIVAFPMQTADIDPDRDLTESAETIYEEAAKLGYGDGCAVWCEFSHFPGQYGDYGMCEIAPGFEFVGIDPLLTEMFGGRPPEDDAAIQPQEATDWRPAARRAIIDDARAAGLLNVEATDER